MGASIDVSSLSLIACGGSQSQYAGQWPVHPAGSFPHNYSTCTRPMHKSVIIKILRMGWGKSGDGTYARTNAEEMTESMAATKEKMAWHSTE